MLRYRYSYKTIIQFSENIFSHHFLLKCIPHESEAQKVLQSNCQILPQNKHCKGYDSFGNTLISGYIGDFHNYFEFISEGMIESDRYKIKENLNPVYLYKSKLTQPLDEIVKICRKLSFSDSASVHEKIFMISEIINSHLVYLPGVTSIQTSAEEALNIGQGVCQDFAHVMISVCRNFGIPARYVNGFMEGEGLTHAWIEYYYQNSWFGFDPTHNRPADFGYIKLTHGRDYNDCVLDKGIFKGLAQQNMEISLKVEQIQQ